MAKRYQNLVFHVHYQKQRFVIIHCAMFYQN